MEVCSTTGPRVPERLETLQNRGRWCVLLGISSNWNEGSKMRDDVAAMVGTWFLISRPLFGV